MKIKQTNYDTVLEALKGKGLQVAYDDEWVGPPEKRERKMLDTVRGVVFPLTADEWCSLCMRSGNNYVGGCCGNTSAIQDIFNGIFREGGYSPNYEVAELLAIAATHEDGFETFSEKLSADSAHKLVKKWDKLDPIGKIGLCCRAVKHKLKPTTYDRIVPHKRKPKDFVRIVANTLQLLGFHEVFGDRNDKTGQWHANTEYLLAKAVPACRSFLDATVKVMTKPFTGVAIIKKDTGDIADNRLGLCIYKTEKDALDVMDIWRRAEEEARDGDKELLNQFVIKKVCVDANNGVVILE